jgi:16S rRNA (guanine1207-N2)-methyltransferase
MTDQTSRTGLYGMPPAELVDAGRDAVQLSPLMPGAETLDGQHRASFSSMVMLAPPGTIERRYAIALALRALAPGAEFTVLAPKDKGGLRLARELAGFGCEVVETAKAHHRICVTTRPDKIDGMENAILLGELQMLEPLGLWSQPGVFSWNRIDPGSALLLDHLPQLAGKGADFGCGIGYLAHKVLQSPKVASLTLVDIDRRAVEASRRNLDDPRAAFIWADVRNAPLANLDFVVMNPPFHDGGHEDRGLGLGFIKTAARALKRGGVCWLTANRHLPYEEILREHFGVVNQIIQANGYKVYEARK